MSRDLLIPSLCRQSFGAFVFASFGEVYPSGQFDPNWHVEAVCWLLQEIVEGRQPNRLVLNQPPRSLKSFIISVCLPAWLLGHNPSRAIIVASYADGLAGKLSRECRSLMESKFYAAVFPTTEISERKATEWEFETTANGGRYTATVGGTLTGRGADILIVDDPMKAQDTNSERERDRVWDWFNATAYTRRNSSKNSIVLVTMQRLHEQDLAGRLIAAGWPSLVLPARATVTEEFRLSSIETYVRKEGELLQSLRDSVEDLETTKRQVGSHDFSAQYQQDPLPAKGNIIKAEFLRRYTDLPRFSGLSQVLITCDPASKPGEQNDYTALLATRIAGNHVYVLECARGHWTNVQIRARIEDLALRHRADLILVEDTAIGPALIQDLRATLRVPTLGRTPKGSKEERLYAREGMFEAGQVLFPVNQPWSMDFEKELLGFPSARNDDQVDALLLALEHFGQAQASRVSVPLVGPIIVTSPRNFPGF